MEIKELLIGVLTKTLNKTSDELEELIFTKASDDTETINDEAFDAVLDLNSKHVDSIKSNVKPSKDDVEKHYSRGRKEALTGFEKELKSTHEIESDAQGIELVSAIVEKYKVKPKLTDDQVKVHPLYLDLENNSVKKEDHLKVTSEFDEYKKGHERKEKLSIVKRDAGTLFRTFNPVISENPKVAATREEGFFNQFNDYDFELKDDSNHFVTKDGQRLEDAQGHPVTFKDFVHSRASIHYDFKAQSDKSNSGNQDTGDNNKAYAPKSEADYFEQRAKLNTPEDRIKLDLVWNEVQKT